MLCFWRKLQPQGASGELAPQQSAVTCTAVDSGVYAHTLIIIQFSGFLLEGELCCFLKINSNSEI